MVHFIQFFLGAFWVDLVPMDSVTDYYHHHQSRFQSVLGQLSSSHNRTSFLSSSYITDRLRNIEKCQTSHRQVSLRIPGPKALDGTNSAKRPQQSIANAIDHFHATYIVPPFLQDFDKKIDIGPEGIVMNCVKYRPAIAIIFSIVNEGPQGLCSESAYK